MAARTVAARMMAAARAGQRPADELIAIPARFGTNLEHLRGALSR